MTEQHKQQLSRDVDNKVEGWTWTHVSKKWCYYRGLKAICGKQIMFKHPTEGYELGNYDSKDNCTGCKKKLIKEKALLAKEVE